MNQIHYRVLVNLLKESDYFLKYAFFKKSFKKSQFVQKNFSTDFFLI